MTLSKITIKMKLLLGTGCLMLLALVTGVIAMISTTYLSSQVKDVYQNSTLAAVQLAKAESALWQLRYGFPQFMVSKDEARAKIVGDQEKWYKIIDESLNKYASGDLSPEEKQSLSDLRQVYKQYIEARPRWFELYGAGKVEEAAEWRAKTTTPYGAGTVKAFENIIHLQQKVGEEHYQAAVRKAGIFRNTLIGVVLAAILIGLALSTVISRAVLRPINRAMEVANRLASGDLTLSIETGQHDEAGKLLAAMKTMVEKWREIVTNVKSSAESVLKAGEQLSADAQNIQRASSNQAEKVSQVATAAEEMTQSIVEVAKNTGSISQSSADTSKVARTGADVVNRSVNEVKEIARTVDESESFVRSLGERSKQIGEIVNVINEIADQTNLLALNAAIEAARAGDQGRGFAVVADEVRKLAERTGGATSEIRGMIQAIQNEVDKAVHAMKNAVTKVDDGVKLSEEAGTSLAVIVQSVDGLQQMVQQIASATEQMSGTSEQMAQDLDHVSSLTNETSAQLKHASNASVQLVTLSTNLKNVVGEFNL